VDTILLVEDERELAGVVFSSPWRLRSWATWSTETSNGSISLPFLSPAVPSMQPNRSAQW
jgi:hypothetical protein